MIPRMINPSAKLLMVVVYILTVTVGCTKPTPQTFELDTTPILTGGLGWAVIAGAYVRLKVEPGFGAMDGDYARRGEILAVVARERAFSGRDRGTWYKLKGDEATGWLHQSLMAVYPSLERARNASHTAALAAPGVTR